MRTKGPTLRSKPLVPNKGTRGRIPLTSSELFRFKGMLIGNRDDILSDLQILHGLLKRDAEQGSGSWEVGVAEDLTGTLVSENAVIQLRHLRASLDQINRALARMENGTYGLCFRCDGVIEKERLEAIPYARQCMKCKVV